MTKIIQSLSEDLRNKISAGEVVERPASAVKELLENSLDAGATSIEIVVEKGGHTIIQVTDDGSGIAREEMPLAFERYSTSKIQSVDDLFQIKTLGFRGEALASIASVADVNIVSKTSGDDGAEMEVHNGEPQDIRPAPGVKGTQITVRNLFYNTPARRKFLKSPRTELRQIVQMVKRIALAYPEVDFILQSDGKELLNVQSEKLKERIAALFDPTYSSNLREIEIAKGEYTFSGYVGTLNLVRSRPGEQYLFLNRRFIKDRLLNSSVYAGYQSLTKRGEFPFFVINLTIPEDQVDVNVHPMKTEVRFKDEWRVYHVLKSGVSEALQDILDTIPNFDPVQSATGRSWEHTYTGENRNQGRLGFGSHGRQSTSPTTSLGSQRSPFPDSGMENQGNQPGPFAPADVHGTPPNQQFQGLERAKSYAATLAARKPSTEGIDVEHCWQVHDKYIISQISSGLVVIDQHVAHERILFEEAMAAFEDRPMTSQTLLFPEMLDFSPDEYAVLLEILPYLEKIGFRMTETQKNRIQVESIPSEMGWGNERRIIRDIIDHYVAHRKQYSSFQENLAASFACKAAVKAGDPLTQDEMQVLVNRLFATKHPYYCPHGRPIIVQISLEELDTRFERQ